MTAFIVLWAMCSPPLCTARSRCSSCGAGTAIRATGPCSPPSPRCRSGRSSSPSSAPTALMAQLAESGRNLAFLAFMYGLMAERRRRSAGKRALKGVFAAVAAVIGLQIVHRRGHAAIRACAAGAARLWPRPARSSASPSPPARWSSSTISTALPRRTAARPCASRCSALAVMWAIDLHLYTVDYFTRARRRASCSPLRGVLLALLVPLFALGLRNAPGGSRSRGSRPSSRSR